MKDHHIPDCATSETRQRPLETIIEMLEQDKSCAEIASTTPGRGECHRECKKALIHDHISTARTFPSSQPV